MHRTILLFVGLAGALVACSAAPAVSSQPLAGAWRTSPEDLPYHGKIPRQDTVAINLNLSEDGRGRWQPFYSGEGHAHVPSDEADAQRLRWREAGGVITIEAEDGSSACRGAASPEKLELEVAGCGFLARLVAQPKVAFARQVAGR